MMCLFRSLKLGYDLFVLIHSLPLFSILCFPHFCFIIIIIIIFGGDEVYRLRPYSYHRLEGYSNASKGHCLVPVCIYIYRSLFLTKNRCHKKDMNFYSGILHQMLQKFVSLCVT